MAEEIKPNKIYTSEEAKEYLKVSKSTIKRFLKKGILQANKVGGRYRILGKEILRVVSPGSEENASDIYQTIKQKVKRTIEKW